MLVESAAIRAIDYDPAARELRVRFTSGERYLYRHVPPDTYQAFVTAESKGRFFQDRIRGRFAYQKLP